MRTANEQITDAPPSWEVDLQGWHSDDPIFATLNEQVKPKVIVEIGSWKGASAVHMANLTRRIVSEEPSEPGLDTRMKHGVLRDEGPKIYCLDTWQGGVDHMLSEKPQDHIPRRDGMPVLYEQFLHNIRTSGHGDRIIPIVNTSANGLRYLKAMQVSADIIRIDGSHETPDVLLDIMLSKEILAPGGVMFGDDLDWPTVANAVNGFLEKHPQFEGFAEGIFWVIKRRTA